MPIVSSVRGPSRGVFVSARALSGGGDDDAVASLSAEEMAALDAEAAAAASYWASELSSAAWTEMDEADAGKKPKPATRTEDGARLKKGRVDKSLA